MNRIRAVIIAVCITLMLTGCTPTEQALYGFWVGTGETATQEQIDTATCIMEHESGFNPDALSRTHDRGMFQINWPSWQKYFSSDEKFGADVNAYDPYVNGLMAGEVFMRAGGSFRPWTTAKYCR